MGRTPLEVLERVTVTAPDHQRLRAHPARPIRRSRMSRPPGDVDIRNRRPVLRAGSVSLSALRRRTGEMADSRSGWNRHTRRIAWIEPTVDRWIAVAIRAGPVLFARDLPGCGIPRSLKAGRQACGEQVPRCDESGEYQATWRPVEVVRRSTAWGAECRSAPQLSPCVPRSEIAAQSQRDFPASAR